MRAGLVLAWGLAVFAWVQPVSAQNPVVVRVVTDVAPDRHSALSQADDAIWEKVRELVGPGIRVEVTGLDRPAYQRLVARYVAGEPMPELLRTPAQGGNDALLRGGRLKDLTSLLPVEAQGRLLPLAKDPRFQAGGYWGLVPDSVTASHGFWANLGLLSSLGLVPATTYEELVAQVPVIRAAGLQVIAFSANQDWWVQSTFFSALVGRLGGEGYLQAVRARRGAVNQGAFLAALALYRRLYDDGVLSPWNRSLGQTQAAQVFVDGAAPYLIDGAWRVGAFTSEGFPNTPVLSVPRQLQTSLSVFPRVPGEKEGAPGTTLFADSGYGISRDVPAGSAEEKAALEVLAALTDPAVQRIRYDRLGEFPSVQGVFTPSDPPLRQAQAQVYASMTAGPIADMVWPPEVVSVVEKGLGALADGVATPPQVAEAVQSAWDRWGR